MKSLYIAGRRQRKRPSRQRIAEAIDALDHADEDPFLILVDNARDNGFMQVLKYSPRKYRIEYRESDDRPQWGAETMSVRKVKQAFFSFLEDDEGYKSSFPWRDISHEIPGYAGGDAQ